MYRDFTRHRSVCRRRRHGCTRMQVIRSCVSDWRRLRASRSEPPLQDLASICMSANHADLFKSANGLARRCRCNDPMGTCHLGSRRGRDAPLTGPRSVWPPSASRVFCDSIDTCLHHPNAILSFGRAPARPQQECSHRSRDLARICTSLPDRQPLCCATEAKRWVHCGMACRTRAAERVGKRCVAAVLVRTLLGYIWRWLSRSVSRLKRKEIPLLERIIPCRVPSVRGPDCDREAAVGPMSTGERCFGAVQLDLAIPAHW